MNVVTFDIDGTLKTKLPFDIIKESTKVIIYLTDNGFHIIAYPKDSDTNNHKANLIFLRNINQDPKKTLYDSKSSNPNAHKRLFTEKHKINERLIK